MPPRRRPWLRVLIVAAVLAVVPAGGFGLYLANLAGELPWQEDPTRIPVVPFEGLDIPGRNTDATPAP